jgi:outer membrane protein assembly factor BamB
VAQTQLQGELLVVLCLEHSHEEGPGPHSEHSPSILLALSPATGKRRWKAVFPNTEGQFACDASSCVLETMLGLTAYDLRTGRRLWSTGHTDDAITDGEQTYSGLALSPSLAFAVVDDDSGRSWLRAWARKDGKVRWSRKLDGHPSLPRLHDLGGRVLMEGSAPCRKAAAECQGKEGWDIQSFDEKGGAPGWSTSLVVASGNASALASGDLLVLAEDAAIHGVSASTGQERWQAPVALASASPETNLYGQVLLNDAGLLVWAYDAQHKQAELRGLDPASGQVRWNWPAAGPDPRLLSARGDRAYVTAGESPQATLYSVRAPGPTSR